MPELSHAKVKCYSFNNFVRSDSLINCRFISALLQTCPCSCSNGQNGHNGSPGRDGRDGKDGKNGAKVEYYFFM